uniref:Uncharacterized protein n=1 Tax=Siphoviridae sp. ct7Qv4 TaxID=2827786 RepID=A0A8S5SN32_9CAUD|nr:MAG TPA: hypothetical protein [Siphoviridae sp. ct7Qv4]
MLSRILYATIRKNRTVGAFSAHTELVRNPYKLNCKILLDNSKINYNIKLHLHEMCLVIKSRPVFPQGGFFI